MQKKKLLDFPSNDLPYLKGGMIIPGLAPLRAIEPVFALLDTNVLLSTISCKAQRNNPAARTNLEEAVDAGILRVFATTTAKEEVLRNLPTYSCKASPERRDVARQSIFDKIYFLEASKRTSVNIRRLLARDPTDVPHAQLFEELGLDVIITRDNDWEVTNYPRLGLSDDDLMLLLREYARAAAQSLGIRGLLSTGVALSASALEVALNVFSKLSVPAKILTGIGGLVLFTMSAASLPQAPSPIHSNKDKPNDDLFGRWHLSEAQSRQLSKQIEKMLKRRTTRTLNQHLLRILTLADETLETTDIEQQLLAKGYKSQSRNFPERLRHTLRANKNFISDNDGRWQFRIPIKIEETKLAADIRRMRASWKEQIE